jgi:hypothetical protein
MSDTLKVGVLSAAATLMAALIAGGVAVYTGYLQVDEDEDAESARTITSLERQVADLTDRNIELQRDLDAANEMLAARGDGSVGSGGQTGAGDGEDPPPGAVYLAELEPVSGNVRTEPVRLGGEEYRHPVRQDLATFSVIELDYDLGRRYSRLTAQVGLDDSYTDTDRAWRFMVRSIGGPQGEVVLFDETIEFGTVVPLDVSVDGVLRLRFSVERAFPAPGSGGGYNAYNATWADATLEA